MFKFGSISDSGVFNSYSPVRYAWQGGQIVSQQHDFLKQCFTRTEYDEHGVRMVIDDSE